MIDDIPEMDVICAGFPCQPFSISGKNLGFKDTRGTLFFNICEIIQAKKPNVIVCPPYTLINTLVSSKKSKVMIGAQDTHELDSGAYTGCVSSEMINDLGAKYVIIGHSERRQLFGEDIELLSKKILSAHKHGLKVIFCIGELESEIKNRKSILRKQLKSLPKKLDHKKLIIAYEPVWAIGTGLTPTLLNAVNPETGEKNLIYTKQEEQSQRI